MTVTQETATAAVAPGCPKRGIIVSTVCCAVETTPLDLDVCDVVKTIGTGGKKLRGQIMQIRNRFEAELAITGGDLKAAKLAVDSLKKDLPGVMWCGQFSNREHPAADKLEKHSGLLCADLDSLGPELETVREKLKTSPHLFALFLSPTGNGWKAVFRVADDASKHPGNFRAVAQHVFSLTGEEVDPKRKDIAGLCFMSYDPEIYINENAIELEPFPEPEKPKPTFNSSGEVNLSERQRIAVEILGAIEWQSETSGYCICPGVEKHTTRNGRRDCRVTLDNAPVPTIHCVHNSCASVTETYNYRLRSLIGKAEYNGGFSASASAQFPISTGKASNSADADALSSQENAVELRLPPTPYVPPPLDLLPGKLQDYVHDAAKSLNIDVSFILLPLLGALGSAIGNSRSILLKRKFVQPPVIWSAIIGRSGSRKSPSLEAGCFAVVEHERELMRQNKQAMEIFENETLVWESKSKKERGAKPETPLSLTCLMDDMTLEALSDAMQENPRGILVKKDELSHWFESFDQYHAGKGADVSRWLSLHTGAFFGLDRRTDKRRYRIHQPRVGVTGGIQPKVLRRVLTEDFFERGLPARFLFAHPPMRQDKWSEAEVSDGLCARVLELFGKLWLLQPDSDAHGQQCPKLLPLDSDAHDEFIRYYNECGASAVQADEHEEAAWHKLSGYAARLALVGQLARDPNAESATGDTMKAACDLARWFGREGSRTYAALAETPQQREQRKVIEFIKYRGGTVTERDLVTYYRPIKNLGAGATVKATEMLDGLVKARHGKWDPVPTTPRGGHPTRNFRYLEVSASAEPYEIRGKAGSCADADSPTTQKITPSGEPDTEAETLAHDESGVARL